MYLDHDIVSWFKMMQRTTPFQDWKAFAQALKQDFGPLPDHFPRANLFKLVQTGTVAEFYLEFIALANRSEGLTSEAKLDCFISGLQEDRRSDMKALEPSTFIRAVALAKLFEEKYPSSNKPKQMTAASIETIVDNIA